MRPPRFLMRALALCLWFCTALVHAHGMRISVVPSAEGLAGRVWYSDETAAAGNAVLLHDGSGRELQSTLSDAEGRFAFRAIEPGDYLVVADGEEGHRAEARITLGAVAAVVASPALAEQDAAALAALLRSELEPLREDIARFEQRIRLSDLIGGIGFIAGLAGLLMAWRAQRRLKEF